jgi:hypothetical protein
VMRIFWISDVFFVFIGCCLEEVWSTPFSPTQAVGIALDDLKWYYIAWSIS